MDQQEAALSMPALVTGFCFCFCFLVTVSSHLPVIIVIVVGDGGGKLNSTSEDKRSQEWWEVAPGSLGLASLHMTKTKCGPGWLCPVPRRNEKSPNLSAPLSPCVLLSSIVFILLVFNLYCFIDF